MSGEQVLTIHVKYLSATEFLAINQFALANMLPFFLGMYTFASRMKSEGKTIQWWHVFCGILWFIALALNVVGQYFFWDINDINNPKYQAGNWLFMIQQWQLWSVGGFWLLGWKILSWLVLLGVFFLAIVAEVMWGIVSTNDNTQAVYAWMLWYLLLLLFAVAVMPFEISCSASSRGAQDPHYHPTQTTEMELSVSTTPSHSSSYRTGGGSRSTGSHSHQKKNRQYIINPVEDGQTDE